MHQHRERYPDIAEKSVIEKHSYKAQQHRLAQGQAADLIGTPERLREEVISLLGYLPEKL